jgi:hypothetical protein
LHSAILFSLKVTAEDVSSAYNHQQKSEIVQDIHKEKEARFFDLLTSIHKQEEIERKSRN